MPSLPVTRPTELASFLFSHCCPISNGVMSLERTSVVWLKTINTCARALFTFVFESVCGMSLHLLLPSFFHRGAHYISREKHLRTDARNRKIVNDSKDLPFSNPRWEKTPATSRGNASYKRTRIVTS